MKPDSKTNIVFICEPVVLEIQSLLLAYSLFMRGLRNYFICIPEHKRNLLHSATLKLFDELGAEVIFFRNSFLEKHSVVVAGDAMSNKHYALKNIGVEKDILFLDSDIVCLNGLDLDNFTTDLVAKPADVAVNANWDFLFDKTAIKPTGRTFFTTEDNLKTTPYFNSGVLWIKASASELLIHTWEDLFFQLSQSDLLSSKEYNPFHRDQIAFGLAVEKLNTSYTLLDKKYNFPARRYSDLPADTVLAHYHDAYTIKRHDTLIGQLNSMFDAYPKSAMVAKHIKPWKYLANNFDTGLTFYKFKQKIEQFIKVRMSKR